MATFKGAGLVWDREKNKLLCRFVDGVYETEDEREIKILSDLGFPGEGIESKVEDPIDPQDPKDPIDLDNEDGFVDLYELSEEDLKKIENKDLKKFLTEEGVDFPAKANKDDLVALILENAEKE